MAEVHMTSAENYKLTPEEFLEIKKFPTFRDALDYWVSTKEDPIPYADWQKVYGQIRRLYAGVDPLVPRLRVHLVSAECAKAWKEKMEGVHGDEWRKILGRKEARAKGAAPPPSGGLVEPGDGGGLAIPAPPETRALPDLPRDVGAGTGLRAETLARLGQSFAVRKGQQGPLSDPGNARFAHEERVERM